MNDILSIMAGGQARGKRRANVITAEWTWAPVGPYGNLALEKQHLVHRLLNLLSLWMNSEAK